MGCKSIMILEDEDSIRDMLRLLLELEGYKVFTAANGKEGIDLLAQIAPPNLILLDLMMPVMDGWRFLEALDKDAVLMKIPVIVVTAFGEKTRTIRSNGILKKPIDLDALFSTVQKACGLP